MLSLQQKWLAAQTTKRQIDEQIWNTPDLVVMRPLGQSSVAFTINDDNAIWMPVRRFNQSISNQNWPKSFSFDIKDQESIFQFRVVK